MNYPIVIENFLNENELKFLYEYSKNSQELYNSHKSSCEFWNKRCIYFHSIPDQGIKDLLFEKTIEIKYLIKRNGIIETKLYAEYPQFVKWELGWELLPHCDNCQPDGITPNATPWRSHGCVIYLNDDFEGGELHYPKLNAEIKPKAGMLVVHPAGVEYLHGVKKVTEGVRHTISSFFTYNSMASNLLDDQQEKYFMQSFEEIFLSRWV